MPEEPIRTISHTSLEPRTVEFIFTAYLGGKRLSYGFKVDPHLADAFAPLQRDRELPFALTSQEKAAWQKRQRQQTVDSIAHTLAREFAKQMLKAIESHDPINGYSPAQWAAMHPKQPEA